jgi:type II secretory pathway pseudopilin PulG
MKKLATIRRPVKPSEEGYMLVAVICLVAMLTIALAVALPKISKEIQRDRELETMNRGKQYARAVRMYYKKFGSYPPNVDALVKPTNNIRFLRKKYADPTTGKEDWKPIGVGQNKAPTVMGFFGQPLGGVGMGGCAGSLSGTNTSSSNSLGGSTSSSATSNSSTNCSGNGLTPSSGTPTPTDGSTPTDPNAANTNTSTTTSSTTGQTGQTFGGAGIMGFSPNSPKKSIMVYKKKSHYNEWEFVYDPIAEQMLANSLPNNGSGLPTSGAGGTPGTGNGLGSGSGFSNGGSGFGAGSGSGFGGTTSGTSSGGSSSPTTTTP